MKASYLLLAVALMAMFGKTQTLLVVTTTTKEPLEDTHKIFRAIESTKYHYRQQTKNGSNFDYLKITKAEIQTTTTHHLEFTTKLETVFLYGKFGEKMSYDEMKVMTCSSEIELHEAISDRVKSFQCNDEIEDPM